MANINDLEEEIRLNQADASIVPTQEELETDPELQYMLQMQLKRQIEQQKEMERMHMLQQRQNPVGSDMYEELRNPPRENPFDNFERYDEYNRLGL